MVYNLYRNFKIILSNHDIINSMKLLLVEDEIRLSQALCEILTKNKYIVDPVYDGKSAVSYIESGVYDAVILDVMLPKMNGIEVLKTIRGEHNSVPVLLLTAKDEIQDKVTGLDCGADDYVTKPFSTEELLARIRSLLRRKGEVIDSILSHGDLSLHLKSAELSSGINTVKLALKEFLIMEMLLQNPRQIITKERIIDKIWGGDSEAEYNNVEVYISFLRKKIQFLGAETETRTSRGIGYSLE